MLCFLGTEDDSVRSRTDQDEMQDNSADDSEKNDTLFTDSPRSGDEAGDDTRKTVLMKKEEVKMRTLSGGMVSSMQGKNVRINIPLTTPSRTLSAISYLVLEDFMNQSSRKCGPDGNNKLHLNKTKLHHAEKMIKRGLMELYKGLGYLKVYRYSA